MNLEDSSAVGAWGRGDCAGVSGKLVDYADEELTPEHTAVVARHLEGCSGCRQELAALEGSVRLALSVWNEAPCPNAALAPHRARRTRQFTAVGRALAAGLLIAALVSAWWELSPPDRSTIVGQAASLPGDSEKPGKLAASPTVREAEELAALEAEINHESAAARLVASAEVLANQPGSERNAERSLRFVVEIFPNTTAGADAARRLAAGISKN